MHKITEYEGGIVPGLADRNGHRKKKSAAQRIGERLVVLGPKAKNFEDLGIHSDIADVAWQMLRDEKVKFAASRGSNV